MKKIKVTLIPMFLLTAGVTLSSCATFHDENLGSKVEENKSAQIVYPDAVMKDGPVATLEGQKAEKLMKRYRTEKADAPTEKLLKDLAD